MLNTQKLGEKSLYAFVIFIIGGMRLLSKFIGFCFQLFTQDEVKPLAEKRPFPFKSLLDLNKGDVVLFQSEEDEKMVRIYLGFHQKKDGSFLFFFDVQDSDEIIYLSPSNKTGYDLYPNTSWRIIGQKQKFAVNQDKRKKIGSIITKVG